MTGHFSKFQTSKVWTFRYRTFKECCWFFKKVNKVKVKNVFFNSKNCRKLRKFIKKTDLICAANVISYIPNLNDLMKGLDILISKKGVFVFEEPYLGSMFKKISYDQIYDAHIYIFSLIL